MDNTRKERELKHFDALVDKMGNVWWGHLTPAGKRRMERRVVLLKENINSINDLNILEFGCGTGALSKLILEHIPQCRLTCCDISTKSINLAKIHCAPYKNVSFEVEDVLNLPYASEKFDAIVGNAILHHVDLDAALKECYRLLQPRGFILFFEPNMINPQIAIERNIKFIGRMLQNSPDETAFIRGKMIKPLRESGFTNIQVIPFDFLYPTIPVPFIPFAEKLGYALEKLPLLKEISGSLIISAKK